MENKNYNSLDLFKFIMAICVVAAHTHPWENCSIELVRNVCAPLIRMAVPYFFIVSGFLLGNKLECPISTPNNIEIIRKYLYKIIKMYLIWTIIYLPLAIYNFISESVSPTNAIAQYIKGVIILGGNYNSWPLWYLLSTIYVLILILILMKLKTNIKILLIIGTVIFVLSIVITHLVEYEENQSEIVILIQKLIKHTIVSGRILTGFFYFPIGIYLSKKRFPLALSWIMLIIGYLINIWIREPDSNPIPTAISAIGLFVIIKSLILSSSKAFPTLRKMSTIIYFIHMYVWSIYYKLVYGQKTLGLDSFLFTSIICIIVSLIYISVQKIYKKRIII